MSFPDNRDPLDDRLLRRSLTPTDAAAAGSCLDAETLAAWADGATSGAETEEIERHLATCARCQAMLATFANTDLAGTTVTSADVHAGVATTASNVVPFRSRLMNRWVPVALAAVAASLVIYAAWPARRTSDANRAEQTLAAAAPTPQQPADSALNTLREAPAATAKTSEVPVDRKQDATSSKLVRPPSAAPRPAPEPLTTTPAPAPPTMTGAGAVTSGVSLASPPPPAAAGAAAAPPPAAVATPAKPQELVMLRGTAPNVTIDGVVPTPTTAAASRVVAEFTPPTTPAASLGQSLIGSRAGGAGGGGGGRGALAASPRPVARVTWHVLASGAVERSVNGGQTWTPVTISPAATIVNGAAPSASVCWLIGRAGVVLLSTDGIIFRRVRSPDVADLRSITAIDELQATVTTVDGRVFKTEDGGDHWLPDKE